MTTEADQARANAIPLEVKKDGLRQRQSGDWVLSLVIAAADMDERITAAPMGTRFQCALVEINDDESPTHDRARQHWRGMSPTKQAGMRCKDPVFWAYLSEEMHFTEIDNEESAAQAVREVCTISSRADLDKPLRNDARRIWHDLDSHFQGWRAAEHG